MATVSWILVGLVAGAVARRLSARSIDGGWPTSLLVGAAGALVGGFLATVLGFGGLAGFDVRSLVTAGLTAFLVLILAEARYRAH